MGPCPSQSGPGGAGAGPWSRPQTPLTRTLPARQRLKTMPSGSVCLHFVQRSQCCLTSKQHSKRSELSPSNEDGRGLEQRATWYRGKMQSQESESRVLHLDWVTLDKSCYFSRTWLPMKRRGSQQPWMCSPPWPACRSMSFFHLGLGLELLWPFVGNILLKPKVGGGSLCRHESL